MSKKTKKTREFVPEILDIPEDEIWDYKIEGLAAPHINKPFKNATWKKIGFVIFMIFAILISMYFSVRVLLNTGKLVYENGALTQFSNNGAIKTFDIDYVSTIEYNDSSLQLAGTESEDAKFTIKKDKSQPVTKIGEYAFNCDGTLEVINIAATVTQIDERAFYSCWNLQCIYVDDNNPNYCDVDGVLYNKDMTEIICYPIDHDRYLRLQNGYAHLDEKGNQVSDLVNNKGEELEEIWGVDSNEHKYDDAFYAEYNLKTRTYVIPSTVTKIGANCFNYANLTDVYLPEGLKEIDTLAFYDAGNIRNIYSYAAGEEPVLTTTYDTVEKLQNVYYSLPEGLEKIGSDCFTKDRGLSYMYIPSSVKEIGHHAFWGTVYKEGKELRAVTEMNVGADEATFNNMNVGSQWLPKYDYLLFHKNVNVNYSAQRMAVPE